ncbi:hypothetical protein G9P44_003438 [Scheffersomyces stipitis]|nr:hypothetical protein G9P44_003438 [Scheffersomyces stipitis]
MESLDISFQFDNKSDQSLIRLWRLTNNHFIDTKYSSTERINYRSWRLLSKKLLSSKHHQNYRKISHYSSIHDLTKDSLSDLRPKQSQFLSERPSLFDHSSNLSLGSNRKSTNGSSIESYDTHGHKFKVVPTSEDDNDCSSDEIDDSDISDISEEDEDDIEDEEDVQQEVKKPIEVEIPATEIDASSSQNAEQPLQRSGTSFVRGFSPSHASVSSRSSVDHNRTSITSNRLPPITSANTSRRQSSDVSKNKNIFYIANSPSPPNNNGEEHETSPRTRSNYSVRNNSNGDVKAASSQNSQHSSQRSSQDSRQRSIQDSQQRLSQPPSQQASIQRQGSLFSNFHLQFNSDSGSKSNLPETAVKSENPVVEIPAPAEEYDYSSTDISEDEDEEEVEEDDDEGEGERAEDDDRNRAIAEAQKSYFHDKRGLKSNHKGEEIIIKSKDNAASVGTYMDNDSEWLSVSSEDDVKSELKEPEFHPLQFTKIRPTGSQLFNVSSNSTEVITPDEPTNEKQKRFSSPGINKPRSLLSGLFLNELAALHSNGQHPDHPFTNGRPAVKPSLKRSSTTGIITINQNKSQNAKQRPSIIFTKRYGSLTDISKNESVQDHAVGLIPKSVEGDASLPDDYLLGKQKSIVGISDFTVTTTSAVSESHEADDRFHSASGAIPRERETLSTSLNKISRSVSNNSIRNLLSKSSINLGKLYSKSRFGRSESSFNSERSGQQNANHNSQPRAPSRLAGNAVDDFASNGNVDLSVKIDGPVEPSTNSLLNSQALASKVPTTTDLIPKVADEALLASELSSSLKESIIIDFKLGKIPLPTRVIDNDSLLRNNEGLIAGGDESDFDDYHSKGW